MSKQVVLIQLQVQGLIGILDGKTIVEKRALPPIEHTSLDASSYPAIAAQIAAAMAKLQKQFDDAAPPAPLEPEPISPPAENGDGHAPEPQPEEIMR